MRVNRVVRLAIGFVLSFLLLVAIKKSGLLVHLMEANFYSSFTYPIHGQTRLWSHELERGQTPSVAFINEPAVEMTRPVPNCGAQSPDVVLVVRSAPSEFERRDVIRRTWGRNSNDDGRGSSRDERMNFKNHFDFDSRFNVDRGRDIMTFFVLGRTDNKGIEEKVRAESSRFGDLIIGDFEDSYYNLTVKTMLSLKWSVQHCPHSKLYFMLDTDYLVLPSNLLGLVDTLDTSKELWAGHVYWQAAPMRHETSKWHVTLSEYPFHLWPPYVSGGATLLSWTALKRIYYGSHFVQKFRFEDIFIGVTAFKLGIKPIEMNHLIRRFRPTIMFIFESRNAQDYAGLVACHGFDDAQEMERIFTEIQQKNAKRE